MSSSSKPFSFSTRLSGGSVNSLEPCAVTASLFLFAQGSHILCLHHDSLQLERKFSQHAADITFIEADNVSPRGAGRFIVSYDASRTAIIWDIFTGEELSRFASYNPIKVASWMRNGSLAFGEHISPSSSPSDTNKETQKGTSSYSPQRPPNTSPLVPFSIL